MNYTYKPKGTCSSEIDVTINGDKIIEEVRFVGGCAGNAQGITRLVKGMTASDAIEKLKGIRCGKKQTSCPDQLSIALEQAVESIEKEETTENTEKSLKI